MVTCAIHIEICNKEMVTWMVTWMVTCGNMHETNNKSIWTHIFGSSTASN